MNPVIVLVIDMIVKNIFKRVLLFPIDLLEKRVKRTNWYRNNIPNVDNYPGDKWYREHLDRNYDIVNLGSSSAVFCFNYEGLGVRAFNWALKPQSMEYSFKILKQYYSILRMNGIVLIPFCPFSGLSVTGKWSEITNDKYYHILDQTLIDNYDDVEKRRQHPFLAMPVASIKRLIKDVPVNDMYSHNVQCNTTDEFIHSAKQWIDLWMKQFNITDLNQPLSKENLIGRKSRLVIVKDILCFCHERDLKPVIVLPPAHHSLNYYFTSTFVKNYITSFIEELNAPSVRVLDYLNHPSFTKDELFQDAYYMNNQGARIFTKQVLTDLNLIN